MRLVPLLFLALPGLTFGMSVSVSPTQSGYIWPGQVLWLNASVTDAGEGDIWFRYRIRRPDRTEFQTIRDFTPDRQFVWAPSFGEGDYELQITARNRSTGESVDTTTTIHVDPLAGGDTALVMPTLRQQVFQYSAPACAEGSRFRVAFEPAGGGARQFTSMSPCNGSRTMNVYIAGLKANTDYVAWHQVFATGTDAPSEGSPIAFRTGNPDVDSAQTRALQKSSGPIRQGILLQSTVFQLSVATDLDGNVIWSYPEPVKYFTRPEPGGYFFALLEQEGGSDWQQLLRQVDLAGNIVLETNAGRINEQLAERGMRPITSFHHEARRLPNGRILVLAGTEQMMHDVQGPGEVDIIGDMILVLDPDLQVEWAWDAFDHLDVRRKAILDEKCTHGGGGCPQFRLAEQANDWLHGNSLQLTPDGHILYSARHQDWVIKIDYANGQGSGDVLWRLGPGGDFLMASDSPEPWFSHQHDANFERVPGQRDRMLVFDNGNTRYETNKAIHSRGQVLQIDEANLTAALVMNIDLGSYSMALGSAQRLTNGNYHFNVGWMPNGFSQALEYDQAGQLVNQVETETQQYRSFRMRDLYTP